MAASIRMNQLIKKRDEIEAEIKALNEVLESVCNFIETMSNKCLSRCILVV